MARGVPKSGFRIRNGKKVYVGAARLAHRAQVLAAVDHIRDDQEDIQSASVDLEPISQESDEEIAERIAERFDILSDLANQAIAGNLRAMIVSGPAGLGKSYSIEDALTKWDPEQANHQIVKGFIRATGLYKMLYDYREQGKVLVFDDADSIFFDDTCLNLLKAVCDTTDIRRVSWRSEGKLESDLSGEPIPKSFEFHGTIVFITNHDFDRMIDRGHRLAPHFAALISRSHYIDLAMKNRRDYMIRINMVLEEGMLNKRGFSKSEVNEIRDFINMHSESLREVSLRIVIKVADLYKSNHMRWQSMAKVTCCKN